jgi:hypothetical protein
MMMLTSLRTVAITEFGSLLSDALWVYSSRTKPLASENERG